MTGRERADLMRHPETYEHKPECDYPRDRTPCSCFLSTGREQAPPRLALTRWMSRHLFVVGLVGGALGGAVGHVVVLRWLS